LVSPKIDDISLSRKITDLIALSAEQAVLAVLQDGLPGQRTHLGQRLNIIFVFQEI
jgi:hypothetical protein